MLVTLEEPDDALGELRTLFAYQRPPPVPVFQDAKKIFRLDYVLVHPAQIRETINFLMLSVNASQHVSKETEKQCCEP